MLEPAELESLAKPITAAKPCGESLEDSPELAAFNAYRVFGQGGPWEPGQLPDWRAIRGSSLGALGRAKDLRLLAHLAAAVVRVDGLAGFCQVVKLVPEWLNAFWEQVHPGLDEDAVFRRNALSCLADRIAIVDAVRRAPLISNRQLGSWSLRDVELSQGTLQPAEADTVVPQPEQIGAAFAATPPAELSALVAEVGASIAALRRVEILMRDGAGSEATPDFQPLTAQLQRVEKVLREHVAAHPEATADAPAEAESSAATAGTAAVVATGPIRTRQDAIRVLDAVAQFFRQNEPSSPVPLFIDRAKRLIAKSFLEVLEDIVPDAVDPARKAGGVRDGA
jgi:type VI secretion system protein ImpA